MRRLAFAMTLFAAHAAAAQDATIGSQITSAADHEGMNLYLVAIDGHQVESGTSMWSEDENITHRLSAGPHTLTLQVRAGAANEKMDAVLFATPGQQYSLGAETVMDQQSGEPSSYIAWIQDGSGAKLWTRQFNVITTMTYGNSPWQH